MSPTSDDACTLPPLEPLPFATQAHAGVGGRIKDRPADFVVEEIPAYAASGEGEHLFLLVEKTDLAHDALLNHLARRLEISTAEIGAAGVKDRRAITRQFLSVPARSETLIDRVDTDRIRVVSAARHGNKLRTGHLRGNRFSILIRDAIPESLERGATIARELARDGCPNFYGDQRFGHEAETLRLGLDLVRGRRTPQAIPRARRRFLLRLALSSLQSALFNSVLTRRIQDGLLHSVLPGDVMQTLGGGRFVVADAAAEQARLDRRETVLTGPMFGPEMTRTEGEPAAREARVLDDWGLAPTDFDRFPRLTSGTRRPLIVWPQELRVQPDEAGLRLEFVLPSGAYATIVLREFLKTQ